MSFATYARLPHTVIVLNCKNLAGTRTTGNLNLKAGPEAPSLPLLVAGPLPVRHRYLGSKVFPLGRLSCTLRRRCKVSLACVPA